MLKNKKLLFAGGLDILILALVIFIYPILTSLNISTDSQRQVLQENLLRDLEITAMEQARIVDPNYSWIEYNNPDLSSAVKDAIKEAALAVQKNYFHSLSADDNLAWEVKFDGKTYQHNWMDKDATTPGSLNLTISNTAGREEIRELGSQSATISTSLFNTPNRVSINPNIFSNDSTQSTYSSEEISEFSYYIHLPKGFSIQFYIPTDLKANGGYIAQVAASYHQEDKVYLGLGLSAIVLAIYILVWNKNIEIQAPLFGRLIKLKALPVWMILAACLVLFFMAMSWIDDASSGLLASELVSLGCKTSQAKWMVSLFIGTILYGFLYTFTLVLLYIKYIFSFGLFRYLKEDTLVGTLVRKSTDKISDRLNKPYSDWSWKRLFPLILVTLVFITVTLFAASRISVVLAALIAIAEAIGLTALLNRALVLMQHDYVTTLAAAKELSNGSFSEIQPVQVGAFQPLYNSLIDIRDGFQAALKDGLASQNMKTQLISNVSHDLKTPVTGIKSYAELISMTDNLDDVHEYAKRLENYTDRLNALITDLFDVARANSGDIQLAPVELNLSELVAQVTAEWEDPLQRKNIGLVLNLIPEAICNLDPDKTVRIIDNLFSNVNKYAMENTRVFVSLQSIPDHFVLSVKNISKTPLDFSPEEITERFVRGDKSRHEAGAGLGLAIVKSFMEVQNGSCNVEIDGDLFKISLVFEQASVETVLPESGKEDLPPLTPELQLKSLQQAQSAKEKQVKEAEQKQTKPALESPLSAHQAAQGMAFTETLKESAMSAKNQMKKNILHEAEKIKKMLRKSQK